MWKKSGISEMTSDFKYNTALGKGEVLSSILSGSTTKARRLRLSPPNYSKHSAVSRRTRREHDATRRGKSVDSVHGAFTNHGARQMTEKLFDVVEVEIAHPHNERILAAGKIKTEAEATIKLAVMRRGVGHHFYTMREARK
ncbi:MAG TPA: hypothetical protein VII92_10215 [Anaerolineae bacterium]